VIIKVIRVMNDFFRGIFWVFVSVFSGTMMYILAKDLLASQTQAGCCYWWFGFALLFYGIYFVFSDDSLQLATIKRFFPWIALFVALQAANTTLFFAGLKLIDPSTSSFLQRSQVVFTLILGMMILGERFHKGEWISSVIIISGLILITFRVGKLSFIGSMLVLSSTFLGSVCSIIIRKTGCYVGAHTFAFIRTLALLAFYVSYASLVPGSFALPPAETLMRVMIGSFLGPFLTIISSFKALEYMEAGKVALFGTTQPFFVMISTFLIFGTFPGMRGIAGGILMVVGNIVFIRMNIKSSKSPTAANIPHGE